MNSNNTDFELVKNFVSGDEKAFNEIIRKYQERIYWHARRMAGNHLDADEIVQEVLLVLYKKLSSFQFKSSLYTWIYTITATRSLNFIKRRKLKEIFSFDDDSKNYLHTEEDIVHDYEQKEKFQKMESLLQEIPPKQREVFVMKTYDNLTYEQISNITGKSVGGLKANYFHAIKKLTEMMKDYE